MTQMSENIRASLSTRDDWTKKVGNNPISIVIDKQWRDRHKRILANVAKYIKTGELVSGPDLLAAIDAGIDENIMKYLIHNCNDINYHDKNGQTALHHCVLHYVSLEMLKELLMYGVNSATTDKNCMDARDYLNSEIWGGDYSKASQLLRPLWTYFYDE